MSPHLAALDGRQRQPGDTSSVGLMLCRERNRVVEYALRRAGSPIGVAGHSLVVAGALPAAEGIATGLALPDPAENPGPS